MLDWSQCTEVEQNPKKVSGDSVFCGTRIPVSALFENIDAGATIEEFIEWFPGVTRKQIEAVLSFASKSLTVG